MGSMISAFVGIRYQEAYKPRSDESICFTFGMNGACNMVDIFDNEEDIAGSGEKTP